jgi:hypothetical protein
LTDLAAHINARAGELADEFNARLPVSYTHLT